MSKKMNWSRACFRALQMYHNRDSYCYLYGAKGWRVTDNLVHELMATYPDYYCKYTEAEIVEIKNNSRGKIAYDCSGFVSHCFDKLNINYSAGFYSERELEFTQEEAPIGSMLYTTHNGTGRHIGIDCGGCALHMGAESTNANIMKGIDSVRYDWYSTLPVGYWEHYFTHKDVDYSDSYTEVTI